MPLTHSIDKQHFETSITSVPHSPRSTSTPTGRTYSCLLTEKPCSPRKEQPKVIHSPWQCMPSRSLHSCTVLRMKKPSKSGLRMMLQQVEALLGSRHGGIASSILDLKRFQYLAHSFKEETLEEATTMFEGTGVAITAEGRRHLGAAIGTHSLLKDTSNRRFLHGHINSATRSPCCFLPFFIQQIGIPGKEHPRMRGSVQTAGRCHLTAAVAISHRTECLQ